jgi:hypothetical protein
MVEITNPAGEVAATFDVNDLSGIQRTGQTVVLKRAGNSDVTISAASLDDAGRLEETLRASLPSVSDPIGGASKPNGGFGKVLKWGCLGSLGIIGLLIVIGVIASFAGEDSNDTDLQGSSNSSGATNETVEVGDSVESGSSEVMSEPAEIGDSIALNNRPWTLTVTGVKTVSTIDGTTFDTEKNALGTYLIVDLSMENTSLERQKFGNGDLFTITDDRGRTYEWYASGTRQYGKQELDSNINAGLTAPATLVFDVPTDATGLVLMSRGEFEVALGNVADLVAGN